MTPRAYLFSIPTVMLASGVVGCAEMGEETLPPVLPVSAETASVTLTRGAPARTLTTVTTLVPTFDELARAWLLPATNPWAAYQKATLLSALGGDERVGGLPDISELDVVADAVDAATAVADAGPVPGTMWVVDLRGAASVAFGATLSVRSGGVIAPVITFHNWPAKHEVVPAEETLAALVTMRPKLPPANEAGRPVFLLDAWRLAYRDARPDDQATDNRYMLTPSDLPDAGVLQAQGIRQVFYLVERLGASTEEEDDLHETFAAYQAAGIAIAIVDLATLARVEPGPLWDQLIRYGHPLNVDIGRVTIVRDPAFYFRSRGGFGGPHIIYGGGHALGGRGGVGLGWGGHGGG